MSVRWLAAVCLAIGLWAPSVAQATYSPPLTRVRIDRNRSSHTPSLVYAHEQRTTEATDLRLDAFGVQYIGQFEFDFGFGIQFGAAGGFADVDGTVGEAAFGGLSVETDGYWVGGQLRVYQMLVKSKVDEALHRPSALTAFVNLRGLFYETSGDGSGEAADLEFFTLTGGAGLMAEWSINDYISICPYAWLTPGVTSQLDYRVRDQVLEADVGATLRSPFLIGVDLWIYPFPPNWEDHISISVLGSLVDTEGDDEAFALVLGYTF